MQASRKVDSSDIHHLLQTLYQRGGSITTESLDRSMRLLRSSMDTLATLQEQSEKGTLLKPVIVS